MTDLQIIVISLVIGSVLCEAFSIWADKILKVINES